MSHDAVTTIFKMIYIFLNIIAFSAMTAMRLKVQVFFQTARTTWQHRCLRPISELLTNDDTRGVLLWGYVLLASDISSAFWRYEFCHTIWLIWQSFLQQWDCRQLIGCNRSCSMQHIALLMRVSTAPRNLSASQEAVLGPFLFSLFLFPTSCILCGLFCQHHQ